MSLLLKGDSSNNIRDILRRYGLAILLFAATLGLSILLTRSNIKLNLTIPIVLALVAAAWYGGRGPGLLIGVLFQATTIIYTPIPPDSTVAKAAFAHFSTFTLYVFMALLISGLRRMNERMRSQRDLLEVTLGSIGDGVITTDASGKITFMNPIAEELTGWTSNEALGMPLESVFRISDEATDTVTANPVARVLETGSGVSFTNHTVLHSRSGVRFPIDESASPIRHGGVLRGAVLVFSDVSVRKAAERAHRESEIMHRIVETQESERLRIARDLHDHLGQKMTALRLQIGSLTDKCDDYPLLGPAIKDLQGSASRIDSDIGFLSWELRPTELENLGLVDALGSYLREWSGQYGIAAEFHSISSDDGPHSRYSRQLETNLYRIVQESLNNIVKHSAADHVSVLFQHHADHVVLIIEDNGDGFDSESDQHVSFGGPGGLGLVGMHERAAMLNGALKIDTNPGDGTTVHARIPLPASSD